MPCGNEQKTTFSPSIPLRPSAENVLESQGDTKTATISGYPHGYPLVSYKSMISARSIYLTESYKDAYYSTTTLSQRKT